jgi:hypothetical protein
VPGRSSVHELALPRSDGPRSLSAKAKSFHPEGTLLTLVTCRQLNLRRSLWVVARPEHVVDARLAAPQFFDGDTEADPTRTSTGPGGLGNPSWCKRQVV